MSIKLLNRTSGQVFMGVLLAACVQVSAAAEWVSGQVTAINPETGSIEIDGLAFTLTAAARNDARNSSKTLKSGQAVRYEAEGKLIKRIEAITLPPT
jgi:hypothetical protein